MLEESHISVTHEHVKINLEVAEVSKDDQKVQFAHKENGSNKEGSLNKFKLIPDELDIFRLLDDIFVKPRRTRVSAQCVVKLMTFITGDTRKRAEKKMAKFANRGPKAGNRSC